MSKAGRNILISAYATALFSSGILLPIYAFFVQKIGGGILETSCAVALFSIVTGIIILLIYRTKLSRTYQIECLLVGWLVWLMSILMYCCIRTTTMLFIAQLLNGIGNALSVSAYDAEYSKQSIDDLVEGWSMWECITSIVSGVAAVFGGFITTRYGFDMLIWCMITIATISFLLISGYVYREKRSI